MLRSGIKSIKNVGVGEYFGFMLDGDHRFLLEDFTITHNSIFLPHVGKRAIINGYKVVHYTLELDEKDIAERYDACFSSIPVYDLIQESNNLELKLQALKAKYGNSLVIKFYPTGSASVNTIKNHMTQLHGLGFVPDLVIVDYGDLLKPLTSYHDEYSDLGKIFEGLRGLAGEFQVPVWTACFPGDTLVETPSGPRRIDSIKKGDPVYCFDEENKEFTLSTAEGVTLSSNQAKVLKVVLDNGEEIRCTPSHPFMLRTGIYVNAENLKTGDSLMALHRKVYKYGNASLKKINISGKWKGWRYESRVVAGWKLGRELESSELVHHIDGNHLNDDPTNHEITSNSEHIKKHRKTFNPMWNRSSVEKMIASVRGKRPTGVSCVLNRPEIRELAKIASHRPEVNKNRELAVSNHWKSMTPDQKANRVASIKEGKLKKKQQVLNHKVVSVEELSILEPVYDLEVNKHHNFVLSAGVVVHNSQQNRAGMVSDLPDTEHMGDSIKKAFVADIIITIAATKDERNNNQVRLHISKNRNGPMKVVIPVATAFDKMKFYDPSGGVLEGEEELPEVPRFRRKPIANK